MIRNTISAGLIVLGAAASGGCLDAPAASPRDAVEAKDLKVSEGVGLEAEEADAHNVGGKGAREACARAVEVLSKSAGAVKKFLAALDALILLEDAKRQLGEVSVKPSAPVVASRWRGAEKGKGSHWLVELSNGSFALLWKVKGKWRLVEGERDEVLASVSDAHFKAATQALLG